MSVQFQNGNEAEDRPGFIGRKAGPSPCGGS